MHEYTWSMTVYLEYAIIDNLVINTLLLWFVFRTIKQAAPKWKILLSAVVGTAFALVLPLIQVQIPQGAGGAVAVVAIKIFVGALMVFIVQYKSLTRYILFLLLFLAYTFALGGAIYGVTHATSALPKAFASVPIGVFIGSAAVFLWVLSKLIKFLNVRHSINNYLRDVIITYKDNKFKITSYLDTGNRLVDPKSNAPVVIITMSLFLKIFPDVSIDRIALNKLCKENIEDGHYINFSTVDSESKMFVFAPSAFEVVEKKTKKNCDVRLGVSMRGFKDAVKYDALLNAQLA